VLTVLIPDSVFIAVVFFCSSLLLYVFIVYLYFVFFTFVLPHMA